MKRSIFIGHRWIILLAVSIILVSQSVYAGVTSTHNADSLAMRLAYQVWIAPQEKVYVSTNRDFYISGDTLRFRIYLVDAATHQRPELASKFVYVDLLNPFGEAVDRLKIQEKDGVFAGILPINPELPEGTYTLCAYTQFMENAGKDYFFRKSVPVLSPLSARYRLTSKFDDGRLTVSLTDKFGDQPVKANNISILGPEDEFYAHGIKGRSSFTMKVNDKMKEGRYVRAKFDKYEKFFNIPYDTLSFHISLHPEGGNLIADCTNKVAFKALGSDGLSREVRGTVTDGNDSVISEFSSGHKGMGLISLKPEAGKDYFVCADGKKFPLPKAMKNACSVSVEPVGADSLLIQVKGDRNKELFLIAHSRGMVSLALPMTEQEMTIDRRVLGDGLIQLLLADGEGDILSSSLIFNRSGYIYGSDIEWLPQGEYAVKINSKVGAPQSQSIVSSLMLQSDLKGYVEDQDFYFQNPDETTDYALDMLLMTQGWERYDVEKALRQEFTVSEIPLEIGGEISGVVKSRWKSNPLPGAVVMLISPQINYASQTITDKDGRFIFRGLDWPENTTFVIQVFGESGSKEHNYEIDQYDPPRLEAIQTAETEIQRLDDVDVSLLASGTILLDDLVVTAPITPEESRKEMLAALGVKSFSAKDIEMSHITTYEEVLRKIPGLRIVNGNIITTFTGHTDHFDRSNVEIWIDGTRWTPERNVAVSGLYSSGASNTLSELSAMYPLHIIENIEYFRPSSAMIISMSAASGGGALNITTKDGSQIKDWDADLFVKKFSPQGFQNRPEAYRAHFDYDPTSDEAVINAAWLPSVRDASEVPAQKDCYVEIEGISLNGEPVIIRQSPQ